MQAQQALVTFTDVERPLGDRLLKLAAEIDRIEGYSEPHAIAIARMAERLGAQLGLHGGDLAALKFAALAHDIGERSMKRNYLLRPGALVWEETLDLWRHPILGEQAAVELRLPRHAQLLIRWHHESWNGLGYPDGLSEDAIPLGARILRAVDSYYALISRRPHRPPHDLLEAEQIIADLAGIEFDPQVVKLLLMALAEERKEREEREATLWPQAFVAPDFTPVFIVQAGEPGQPPIGTIQQPEPEIVQQQASLFAPSSESAQTPTEPAPEAAEAKIEQEQPASSLPTAESPDQAATPFETPSSVADTLEFDAPVAPVPQAGHDPNPDTQPENQSTA
jgi:hypothetical protein